MKKGFPSVFARMNCVRGCKAACVSQQRREQLLRLLRPQRIEPQLGVIGLAAPAVLVLGPVIHQQQEAGAGDPLAEEVQPGLRLAVQPVQVFHQQEHGLVQAFAQQQPRDRLKGAPAAQLRVDLRQCGGRLGDAQQGREIGQRVLQAAGPASAPCPSPARAAAGHRPGG